MRLTVTAATRPPTRPSVRRSAWTTRASTGDYRRFAVDHRPCGALIEAPKGSEEVCLEVEDWQFLGGGHHA